MLEKGGNVVSYKKKTKLQGLMLPPLVVDRRRENNEMTKGGECVWVMDVQSYGGLREVQRRQKRIIFGGESGG